MISTTRAGDVLSAMALLGIVAYSAPALANSGHDLGLSWPSSGTGSSQQMAERSSDRLDGTALGQPSGSYRLAAAPPRVTMPAPVPRMTAPAPVPKVMPVAPAPAPKVVTTAPAPAPKVVTAAPAPAKPAAKAPAAAGK